MAFGGQLMDKSVFCSFRSSVWSLSDLGGMRVLAWARNSNQRAGIGCTRQPATPPTSLHCVWQSGEMEIFKTCLVLVVFPGTTQDSSSTKTPFYLGFGAVRRGSHPVHLVTTVLVRVPRRPAIHSSNPRSANCYWACPSGLKHTLPHWIASAGQYTGRNRVEFASVIYSKGGMRGASHKATN